MVQRLVDWVLVTSKKMGFCLLEVTQCHSPFIQRLLRIGQLTIRELKTLQRQRIPILSRAYQNKYRSLPLNFNQFNLPPL